MESQTALSTDFDYGFLPAADGKALEKRAENIERIQERTRRATADSIIKLGAELDAAQSVLSNHGNGTFTRWCHERCGLSKMSVSRFIRSYKCFSEVKDSNKLLPSFDQSALYLLSADTCPEAAFDKAIEIAESGEVVTHKKAKELVAEFTPTSDEDDPEPQGWSLHDALEYLNEAMEDIETRWPAEFKETLGRKLIAMGEAIVELSASQEEEAA